MIQVAASMTVSRQALFHRETANGAARAAVCEAPAGHAGIRQFFSGGLSTLWRQVDHRAMGEAYIDWAIASAPCAYRDMASARGSTDA